MKYVKYPSQPHSPKATNSAVVSRRTNMFCLFSPAGNHLKSSLFNGRLWLRVFTKMDTLESVPVVLQSFFLTLFETDMDLPEMYTWIWCPPFFSLLFHSLRLTFSKALTLLSKADTSLKRTLRVGPCHYSVILFAFSPWGGYIPCSLPFFSLWLPMRQSVGPNDIRRLRESWLCIGKVITDVQ